MSHGRQHTPDQEALPCQSQEGLGSEVIENGLPRLHRFAGLANVNVIKKVSRRSPSADMVQLYVKFQFQVKPLSTGISSSRTKKNSSKNACMDPPRYVLSLESLAQV